MKGSQLKTGNILTVLGVYLQVGELCQVSASLMVKDREAMNVRRLLRALNLTKMRLTP